MKMDFNTVGNFHPVTDHAISTNDENLSLFIHLGHLVAIKMIYMGRNIYYSVTHMHYLHDYHVRSSLPIFI